MGSLYGVFHLAHKAPKSPGNELELQEISLINVKILQIIARNEVDGHKECCGRGKRKVGWKVRHLGSK